MDHQASTGIKVELIESLGPWGEKRFRLRVNDRQPQRIKEATLTEVFDRLRVIICHLSQADSRLPLAV